MKRIVSVVTIVTLAAVPASVLGEVPATVVTPQNAGSLDVKFSVNIVLVQGKSDVFSLSLTVENKSKKHDRTRQPLLYLEDGTKRLGIVALYRSETDGDRVTYWCELSKDLLVGSSIAVSCFPSRPDKDRTKTEANSMQYVLAIREFMKKP
jgi:hypothetical protein